MCLQVAGSEPDSTLKRRCTLASVLASGIAYAVAVNALTQSLIPPVLRKCIGISRPRSLYNGLHIQWASYKPRLPISLYVPE